MQFVDTQSAKIATEVIGTTGPWITFLNGHTRPRKDFKLLSKWIADLGFRCLLLDHRGAGDTIAGSGFAFNQMVEDIDAVHHFYQINASVLLGISMGGYLAQAFTKQFVAPRVSGLILISTTAHLRQIDLSSKPWGTDVVVISDRLSRYVSDDFFTKNKLLINAMAAQIARQNTNGEFDERAIAQRQALVDYLQHPNETITTSTSPGPVLILHGQNDRIIPVEAAQDLHQSYPGSSLKIFENCGHLILAERANELKVQVGEFLVKNFSRN